MKKKRIKTGKKARNKKQISRIKKRMGTIYGGYIVITDEMRLTSMIMLERIYEKFPEETEG